MTALNSSQYNKGPNSYKRYDSNSKSKHGSDTKDDDAVFQNESDIVSP